MHPAHFAPMSGDFGVIMAVFALAIVIFSITYVCFKKD